MRRHKCPLCSRSDFSSMKAVLQHIMSQHVGVLDDESIEYLLRTGATPEKIVDFCKENKIKVDKKKVYRIALKLTKNGEI